MGIYDREYYQDDSTPRGFTLGQGPRMMVVNLVIITGVVFLANIFSSGWIDDTFALEADVYRRPLQVYQLLAYGFLHAGIWHILINMFLLWMFGRVIEERLGRVEFLLFYLIAIVFSGLCWVALENAWLLGTNAGRAYLEACLAMFGTPPRVVGASGGVTAVFIMFVLYYPRQTLLVWGVFPAPAWVIGAVIIGLDILTAVSDDKSQTAWQAHLGGAAFAYLYLQLRWNFSRLLPSSGKSRWTLPGRRPKFRIHAPDDDDDGLAAEADRILAKMHREGEQSLTSSERRTLERYSRQVRDKRR